MELVRVTVPLSFLVRVFFNLLLFIQVCFCLELGSGSGCLATVTTTLFLSFLERDTFLERLYELHPIARGLSPEGHCNFLMGDDLPHETENTVYGYLIAISKLGLGILTEPQGELEGS